MTTDYLGNETFDYLIGLTLAEAEARLEEREFRVVMEDGEPLVGTADFDTNRINVAIESGKISAIEGEG